MYSEEEVTQFIQENDVKFIRLAFCDIYGIQRNISIMPTELERAMHDGISFDASALRGFGDVINSELFLIPELSTLSLLPWRPTHGRVVRFYCNIVYPDGTPFKMDSRYILKQAVEEARKEGFICNIGTECEFYLFQMDAVGNPTDVPHDNAGYLSIAPEDKGENIRREICLTLEEMGIRPECSYHEEGPGQHEIDFMYSDALTAADNVLTFKSVVRTLAAHNGLHATFRPKPIKTQPGNGFHVNVSPHKMGAFEDNPEILDSFMAGIMKYISEMTLFLNPCSESYERLGNMKAPKYISWSPLNRTQLVRVPAERGGHRRVEFRSPDSMTNPYLVCALLIYAGIEGIKMGLKPEPALNIDLIKASADEVRNLERLPQSFEKAYELAINSNFIKSHIPEEMLECYQKQNDMTKM